MGDGVAEPKFARKVDGLRYSLLMQPSVRTLFNYLDSWLDGDLTEERAKQVQNWPFYQLQQFGAQWPEPDGDALEHELRSLSPGELRPIAPLTGGPLTSRGQQLLSMLLYAPTVVVPADDLWASWFDERPMDREARHELFLQLKWLGTLRPFIESGAIEFSRSHFGDELASMFDGVSNARTEGRLRLVDDMTREDWAAGGWTWPQEVGNNEIAGINRAVSLILGTSLVLARDQRGQFMALDRVSEIAMTRVLTGRPVQDGRLTTLQRLGQFDLPSFMGDPGLLLRLREDDAFERWREALSSGMAVIGDIEDKPEGRMEATAILADSLQTQLFNLRKAAGESPTMSAARNGSKSFVVGGIGAAVGTAITHDVSGLAGSIVSSAADMGWQYINELRKRRSSYAVLDMTIAFTDLAR